MICMLPHFSALDVNFTVLDFDGSNAAFDVSNAIHRCTVFGIWWHRRILVRCHGASCRACSSSLFGFVPMSSMTWTLTECRCLQRHGYFWNWFDDFLHGRNLHGGENDQRTWQFALDYSSLEILTLAHYTLVSPEVIFFHFNFGEKLKENFF